MLARRNKDEEEAIPIRQELASYVDLIHGMWSWDSSALAMWSGNDDAGRGSIVKGKPMPDARYKWRKILCWFD
ncbi:hypothetical protein Ct61P_14524 [Colletotrichum tofieldiae]|nr:hypothetical protein Ct61P_14524 [Colletotrichum tofieldiae]